MCSDLMATPSQQSFPNAGNQGESNDMALRTVQDIIYGVSHGEKWIPKHLSLGSTLHQTTRSKASFKSSTKHMYLH